MNVTQDENWIYFNNPSADYITGKYLFFSADLEYLKDIIKVEFSNGFNHAKISKTEGDHVLCLYYKDDSRKKELADRYLSKYPFVSYRYWKSDDDTLSGIYSERGKKYAIRKN